MKLKSHIPIKIDIGEGEELALGVKRLTYEEAVKLRAQWKEAENATADKKDEVWGSLLLESFRRYVRLQCEVIIECSDGDVVMKKAEELLEFFGARTGVLNEIFFSILAQSSMSGLQKKLSLSRIASSLSSGEPKRAAPGTSPGTTATSAGNGASAESEGASSEAPAPSGSTEGETTPSSSTNVPYAS